MREREDSHYRTERRPRSTQSYGKCSEDDYDLGSEVSQSYGRVQTDSSFNWLINCIWHSERILSSQSTNQSCQPERKIVKTDKLNSPFTQRSAQKHFHSFSTYRGIQPLDLLADADSDGHRTFALSSLQIAACIKRIYVSQHPSCIGFSRKSSVSEP